MGENSKIEWTDHTFNPWWGCTKVAAGCTNCYAEAFSKRTGRCVWGPKGTRVKTSEAYWKLPVKWNQEAAKNGTRPRVFCASMADVFEDWNQFMFHHTGDALLCCDNCGRLHADNDAALVSSCECTRFLQRAEFATMHDVRRQLFKLIDATPNLDWILLTKRPANVVGMWPSRFTIHPDADTAPEALNDVVLDYHRPNVWLMTSIAEQKDADANVPELFKCRDLVPVLGLSCEPLIGVVNLSGYFGGPYVSLPGDVVHPSYNFGIDWVIVGGESGHGARPMHPAWARLIRDQCVLAGVPLFFKQWGEWEPSHNFPAQYSGVRDKTPCMLLAFDGHTAFSEAEMAGHGGYGLVVRTGKQVAGRMLDKRTWSEFPTTRKVNHDEESVQPSGQT